MEFYDLLSNTIAKDDQVRGVAEVCLECFVWTAFLLSLFTLLLHILLAIAPIAASLALLYYYYYCYCYLWCLISCLLLKISLRVV